MTTITTRQAAETLRVSLSTIYRRIRSGAINAVKIGRRWAITLQETPVDTHVTIHYNLDRDGHRNRTITVAGRRIAHRAHRDAEVVLGPGVRLISGGFARVGRSWANPTINPTPGTVVEVIDLPIGHPDLDDPDMIVVSSTATPGEIATHQAALAVARDAGPLATPRQVEYILQLLQRREINGDGDGFVVGGPTTRAQVELLSRTQASTYIDSLTGNY